MKILIAYSTTEGHTRKIANAVAAQTRDLGHTADLFDTSALQGRLDLEDFDKVIVAGSVHEERHQESLELFVVANREKLTAKSTMFISVSLAAAFDNGLSDAQAYVERFYESVDWQPDESLLIAGALRHEAYGYYGEQILQHVVLKDRDLSDPELDHDFTDWEFLAKAVSEFVSLP